MYRQMNKVHSFGVKTLVVSLLLSLSPSSYPGIPQSEGRSDSSETALASPGGGAVLIGQRIGGIIDNNSDAKVYQFQGVAGESVKIEGNATSGDLDPTVTLFVDPALKCTCQGRQAPPDPASATVDWRKLMDGDENEESEQEEEREREKEWGPDKDRNRARGEASASLAAVPMEPVVTAQHEESRPASQAAPAAFSRGDVFAAVGNGKVKRFSPTGTLLQTLDSGSGSQFTAGMGFDSSGNAYVTQFSTSNVFKFDINGNLVGSFGSGFDAAPESIIVDSAQNIYVGQANNSHIIRKFNSSGTLLDTFSPALDSRGTDWIELASDQRTLFYTSEGKNVKRFDVATKTQLANFNTAALPGSAAYALRILPGGGVLVADTETIVRLDAAGNVVQQYDAPGEDDWFAVNLDPDGQTFWSGSLNAGKIYRFNLATGAVVTSWDSAKFTALGGLSVFGEITAAQVLSISKSAPATVKAGDTLTYTINFGNSGTVNASNVAIKDSLPVGTTFVSAANGGTLNNGVVTWNIGTLNAGVTGQTVSYTVRVGSAGGNIINNNYTIEAAGIAPIKGAPVITSILQVIHDDNSGGGVNALIKSFQLPFTGSYRVVVASANGASSGGFELAVNPIDQDSNIAALSEATNQATVKVYNTKQPNTQIFSNTGAGTTFLAFSPDGTSAAISEATNQPTVRLMSTSQLNSVIFSNTGAGSSFLGYAPDGASAAILEATNQPTVKIVSTKQPNTVLFSSTGAGTTFLGFAPDGASAALLEATNQTTVKVVSTREVNKQLFSNTGAGSTFLGFASDGSSAALSEATNQPTVKVFSTRQTNSQIFSNTGAGSTFVGFAPDGFTAALVEATNQQTVRVFSTKQVNNEIFSNTGAGSAFSGFSPDGLSVALTEATNQPTVKVFSTRQPNSQIFSNTGAGSTFIGFAPDSGSATLSEATNQTTVKVFSTRQTNSQIFSNTGAGSTFSGFAPDGASVAILEATNQPTVKLFNTRQTDNLIFSNTGAGSAFAGFAPDGATAAVAESTNQATIKLFSTKQTNTQIFSATGAGSTIISFAPDGASAAFSEATNQATVRVVSTRQPNAVIFSNTGAGSSFVGFAPDGATAALVEATNQPTVKVFSTRLVNSQIFSNTGAGSTFLSFAPDGTTAALVEATNQKTVKVFSTRDVNSLTFSSTGAGSTFVGYSLDGDTAAISEATNQATVRLFSTRQVNTQIASNTGAGTTFAAFSFDRTHGTLPTAPNIGLSSQFLDFGNVAVGQTKDLALTISNTGNAPLTVSSLSFSASQFTATSPSVPFNIAAGGQQAVNVRFTPTSASVQTGVMAIASNDPNRPGIDIFMFGNGPGCLARPANLVAWYPGDGNANDIQGGNTATLQNGTGFAAGQVSQGFNLDGVDDQVLTPTLNLGNQFSVEFWMRPTSSLGFQHIISNNRNANSEYGALYYNGNHLEYWQNGAVKVSSSQIALNAFSHVALTYDGSVARLYVNGVLAGTSSTHTETFNNAVLFGYALQAESNRFAGQVDEASFYSRALSTLEVQSVISAGSAGKCKILATAPVLDVSPTSLDFGTVTVGQTKDLTLTVRNTGGSTLTVTSFNINNPRFTAASPAVPFNVSANGQQNVIVRFSPTAITGESGTLTMTSNDPNSTGQTVLLIGNTVVGAVLTEGFDDITTLQAAGWLRINHSAVIGTTNWFQGSLFAAQSGAASSYIEADFNNTDEANTISNWLLTPPVTLKNGSTMTFFTRTVDGPIFPDRLQVRMSTNGSSSNVGTTATDVGDFSALMLDINPTYTTTGYPSTWTQFTVTVSGVPVAATGRLAFRYFVEDGGPSGNNSDTIGIDTFQYNSPSLRHPVSDFDGDGKSDVAVWRETDGVWYMMKSSNNTFSAVQFGVTADKIVPGDYDGDGKTDVAVYRPSTGTWYVLPSTGGFTGTQFGLSTDLPAQGDFDGDGKTDIAVFRPSSGTWYILGSTVGFSGTQFGANGDKPVVGDYDGDGKSDIAVYRPSDGVWYQLRSSLGFTGVQFGIAADKVVPADYDGDGKADLAVYRDGVPGIWYLLESTGGFVPAAFGTTNDIPTPGDFDGDGKADVSVYRPSIGTWYLLRSTSGFAAQQFGASTDKPVPAGYVPVQ